MATLKITPGRTLVLSGKHPSTGEPVHIPVPWFNGVGVGPIGIKFRNPIGPHARVSTIEIRDAGTVGLYAPCPLLGAPNRTWCTHLVKEDLVVDLVGDLYHLAAYLGVEVPAATKREHLDATPCASGPVG